VKIIGNKSNSFSLIFSLADFFSRRPAGRQAGLGETSSFFAQSAKPACRQAGL